MTTLNILIVEDEQATRTAIHKRLAREGYGVETAPTGEDALAQIAAACYDVILTDLRLPGNADGITVLESAKNRWSQTEVILMTSFATVKTAVEAMKKGACDYLNKPLDFDELFLKLQKIQILKWMSEETLDLREAIQVTESSAAQTIQSLETAIQELQDARAEARKTLASEDTPADVRIREALRILSNP